MAQLSDRDRQLVFAFVAQQQQRFSNSKPDWVVDFIDLTNPEIQQFLGQKVVESQAAIDSLEANKIRAQQSLEKDILDLTALADKLRPSP